MTKKLEVKELKMEHLSAVLQLQDKIIAGLHEDEKHFILRRSAEDFIKALDSENTHMLGVFDGDKLVAQSIFDFPQKSQKREMPEFAGNIPHDELVIYKAILVDTEHRGSGLMKSMLAFIENKAVQAGKKHSIIQIAIDNPASWISALKNGMSIRKVDKDPEDGAKVLYLQKTFEAKNTPVSLYNLDRFAMYIGQDIHKEIPALFNKMQYWVARGYQGIGIHKETNSILWAKDGAAKNQTMSLSLTSVRQGNTTQY